MSRLGDSRLAAVAPWAIVGGLVLAAIAMTTGVPALAPVAAITGAATTAGLVTASRRPATLLVLAAPALALTLWIMATGQGAGYWIAVAAIAAGSLAGHPAIFGLIVLASAPVFLVGWGIPPAYVLGWVYAGAAEATANRAGPRAPRHKSQRLHE